MLASASSQIARTPQVTVAKLSEASGKSSSKNSELLGSRRLPSNKEVSIAALLDGVEQHAKAGCGGWVALTVCWRKILPLTATEADARRAMARLALSCRRWRIVRGADPFMARSLECGRRLGLHHHALIACPRHLTPAFVRHVETALRRIAGVDKLPPHAIRWGRRRAFVADPGTGQRRLTDLGHDLSHKQAVGWAMYAAKHIPAEGSTIHGVRGRGDRRPVRGRRLTVSPARTRPSPHRPVRAPARRRATTPRPIAAEAQPVAVLPPAPLERPVRGGNTMRSFRFTPVMTSEGGRSAVQKAAGSTGLTAAGVKAFIDGAIRRGARLSVEQVDVAAKRVRELIAQARSPAQAGELRKLLSDVAALRPSPEPVTKMMMMPSPDPVPGTPDSDVAEQPTKAELAEMERRVRRLLARVPAEDRPRLEALLADVQRMRDAFRRGAVVKAGLHPLRQRALARAEAARGPVAKAGAGLHPLRRLALARAAEGRG